MNNIFSEKDGQIKKLDNSKTNYQKALVIKNYFKLGISVIIITQWLGLNGKNYVKMVIGGTNHQNLSFMNGSKSIKENSIKN